MQTAISDKIEGHRFIYLHGLKQVITKNLLIFKTNIDTKDKANTLRVLFKNLSFIVNWSIDMEDIDNVLRIEHSENLQEIDIVALMDKSGFYCELLND